MAKDFEFTIAFDDFDTTLLPPDARTPGTPAFVEAVRTVVTAEYEGRGGWARVVVDEKARLLNVSWGSGDRSPDLLESAVEQLQRGQYDTAIRTLEVLRFQEPNNIAVLYNLGMALSDRGRLPAAIAHLRRAAQLDPSYANAHVALGVALARAGQTTDAIATFRAGIRLDAANLWAYRNLGGCLLGEGKAEEAEAAFRKAVELSPNDPAARVGLGRALFDLDQLEDADEQFVKAIELDPRGQVGESAKEGRSRIAQITFRSKLPGSERPDAVMYCLNALERFDGMSPQEVQKVGYEIAILGMGGIDPNDPAKRYKLRSLAGEFSGLQLLCLMFAAFKTIDPNADTGFDVSREYCTAVSMHNARKRKQES